MTRIRTDYKPWLKVEYRGKQIDLPHDVGYVVVNRLGEVVGYQSQPRLNGDSWGASGFAYILATNVDATRWWESLTPSVYLMDAAAGVLPREAKQQAYRNYWYAGGPIRVPTWAQWVAEDKHGNIVAIEGAMRPNIGMYGKWAPKRNQLHVRRDRSGNGWRSSRMNLDHLPTMEQYLPKGFKDELRPINYQRVELMVPSWVNFITTDPNGDIHGHHTRPSIWCEHQWMSNTGSIPMCYLGYTPNHGNWKDTLLILEQKESEQKVEKEQKPKWGIEDDIALVKAWVDGGQIVELAKKYTLQMEFTKGRLRQFGLLLPYKPNAIEITDRTTIACILGAQLDGTCGEVYYLPKKEDSIELAVLVGFARGFSLKRIAEQTGIPAADVVTSVIHSLAEVTNFVNRLRFGYWGDVGELTIAQYKKDKSASPVSAQIKEDLADHPRAKGDDQHRPEFTPAESFTMVTFKLPSKTVATQETMLTDEMFLAGVAFGMRLNKLLSKQGDSDVKEGS